ncbi:hypothetical protein [Pseudomonas moraviensis]|uniref:hypothetical protein n=1 Tax=Pseudomonas moraviensis TaxID=321662 RepID=UPI002093EDE3|nr:hypothetical protein [Pseudomonas moraviensis]UST60795.1 hypothetical protein NF672_09715 [Pseudomonas moraviensis]UST66012.1 hypothetical protein NF673_09745 [Pseudomonas moraviensis]UST71183.1 hypothetical protein NF674_09665 [Pseudomonas moraviensis]
MPWLRGGTVAVTSGSTTVVGTNADFVANARVGDAFVGPDGLNYEIGNIASPTQLSIIPAYKGATVSGSAYAIMPVQGYPKLLADAFNGLKNQFGTQLAALGTTGNYDILPVEKGGTGSDTLAGAKSSLGILDIQTVVRGGTGANNAPDALTNLGALPVAGGKMTGALNEATVVTLASASTVNIGAAASNIVSISGNTTITSLGVIASGARRTLRFTGSLVLTHNSSNLILPGGANITTLPGDSAEFLSFGSGSWACLDYSRANGKPIAFAYDRSNILGALAQAGGVPTGGIIERSSNSNGSYVKFADGTLICTQTNQGSLGFYNASNIGFIWTYPHPFSSYNFATANIVGTLGIARGVTSVGAYSRNATTANISAFSLGGFAGSDATSFTFDCFAIGRWYE